MTRVGYADLKDGRYMAEKKEYLQKKLQETKAKILLQIIEEEVDALLLEQDYDDYGDYGDGGGGGGSTADSSAHGLKGLQTEEHLLVCFFLR